MSATSRPPVQHLVDLTGPGHEVRVTTRVSGLGAGPLRVYMPSWTPGSYLVRDFARHVEWVRARQGEEPRPVRKSGRDEWTIDGVTAGEDLTIETGLHAHELSVRTNYLGPDRALLAPAATFLAVPGREADPHEVEVRVPAGWPRPECPLPERDGRFLARDHEHLVDSPIAAGPCRAAEFDVLGVPHRLVVHGEGDFDLDRLARDAAATCRAAAAVFGDDLPCERYLFLIQLGCTGGLEHADSSVCGFPVLGFATEADQRRRLSLIAHEYFHLWNVKRIRPQALGPFDLRREVLVPHLWVAEGLTSYYQHLLGVRAGQMSPARYLTILASYLLDLERTPGRFTQSLEDSSVDAWIKYYRPDENSRNSQVSYYAKGAVAGFALDVTIRALTIGRRSLDDAFRVLLAGWRQRPDRGYSDAELWDAFAEAAGRRLEPIALPWIRGTGEIDVDALLADVGLKLDRLSAAAPPSWLGVTLARDGRRAVIERVVRGGPACQAGLSPGEEIIAIDGFRVLKSDLRGWLARQPPDRPLRLVTALLGRLREVTVRPAARPSSDYRIRKAGAADAGARAAFSSWLGMPWAAFEPLDERPEDQRGGHAGRET